MKWWKEKKEEAQDIPLKPVSKPSKKEESNVDLIEYNLKIEKQLAQVESDIKNINWILNDMRKRIETFEVCYQNLMERNIDAIEMKEAFLRILEMAGYTKIREQ